MVIVLIIGINHDDDEFNKSHGRHNRDVLTTAKAIQSICQPTDYKEACIKSLAKANSTDPKELIRVAFHATKNMILEASHNSTLLKHLSQDPRTKVALEDCQEMAQTAANDLERSLNMISNIDHVLHLDIVLDNLKIWLSGALTYQQTCLDGFENTTGVEAGEKMQQYLKMGMELTSNGLAMVDEISQALSSLNLDQNLVHRRLLSDQMPSWVDDLKPNLVVAKDGTGDFTNITAALNSIPRNREETFVLYIKAGVYEEKVQVDRNLTHLVMVGDGPTKTKITGRLNWVDGVSTFNTASAVVLGDHFIGKDIGFENYAGPEKHQAVALRVGADMSIFYNCHINGYQDTLYAHTYRQFYRNCVISGTIDFIFGDSAAVFQNCTMLVRKPLENQANIITAHGRKEPRQPTGLVLQNCKLVADPTYYPVRFAIKTYLARPWKEYSRTVIMESFIDDLIADEGFLPWGGTFGIDTCYYVEYNNRGPGSIKFNRTIWPGIKEVGKHIIKNHFIASKFLDGNSWIPKTGVPYYHSLIYPTPADRPNAIKNDKMLVNERDNSLKQNFENFTRIISPVSLPNAPTPSPSPSSIPVLNIQAPAPSPNHPHGKGHHRHHRKSFVSLIYGSH
ncbi:pectinesterase-like [Impatiens glandulifera]|uniref:pectinesterase-like n=1 Tax=Impatiens glandulifera TaxID=253017 RepID=UPI001FB0EB48|nr:pectinesterase-like [Impatiens glandulifera]